MEYLVPPAVQMLEAASSIGTAGVTVQDFWAWTLSDLRTNTARSRLAEYVVALALGVHHGPRIEWDSHDVTAPDGTRIEVKSSAYLQAWNQRRHFRISFSRLRARAWSEEAGQALEVTYSADVYVFAVQTAMTHEDYDALDLRQSWDIRDRRRSGSAGRSRWTLPSASLYVKEESYWLAAHE